MPSFTVTITIKGDIPKKEIERKMRVLKKALRDDMRANNEKLRKPRTKRRSE
jgi:hypothetical protein